MSSKERRAEKQREREAEETILAAERQRKEALNMYWRINEAKTIDDIKDILERIREHLGLE